MASRPRDRPLRDWRPSALAVALGIAIAVLPALPALASPAQRPTRLYDSTGVTEVLVPIQIVDKHGQAVRGLEATDFEILDGRRKRPIAGFQTIDLDLLEPDPSRFWDDGTVPAAGRRHFLLLFDLTFSSPATLLEARRSARELVLQALHPTDLVAVGTHSVDRGGRILMAFTADRGQAARAIDAVGGPGLGSVPADPTNLKLNPAEQEYVDPGVGSPSDIRSMTMNRERTSDLTYWVLDQERQKSQESLSSGQVSSWAASLTELAGMLDSLKGRKQVLYFSEGFDGQLIFGRELSALDTGMGEDQRNQLMQRHWSMHTDDRYGNTGLLAEVDAMIEAMRRSDCVVHTIDIAGLRVEPSGDERRRQGRRHALFYIARESGGVSVDNANDLGVALAELLERTALTYLTTFRIDDVPADGAYHPLKVRAALPGGGRISVRAGFYAPRPFRELHPMERELLTAQAIASGGSVEGIELNLVAAAFPAAPGRAYVPVVIEVSGASLLAGQREARLPVELYTYVTDREGEIRDSFTQMVTLELGEERARFEQRGVKFYGHLDLSPGDYLIRVLVRHQASGRFGLQSRRLAVPDFDPTGPVLLPPFFLDSGDEGWVLVRERPEAGDASGGVVYPFTLEGEPFIPAAHPRLDPNVGSRLCLIAYHFGRDPLEVEAMILDGAGARVAGEPALSVERTVTGIRGLDKLAATFRPQPLEPGDYTLQVEITDPESGWTEVATAPFAVGPGGE